MFDHIRKFTSRMKEELASRAANIPDLVLEQIGRRFPGLSPELIRQQWVPIPQAYLQEELRRRAASVKIIERIVLECQPGHFLLTIDSAKARSSISRGCG